MNSWQEAVLFNTTEIVARGSDEEWFGTGFFILANDRLFLVSNRHVLEDDKEIDYSITVHRRSSVSTGVVLELGSNKVHIDYGNPFNIHFKTTDRYVAPQDSDVDLALVDLTGIADPPGAVIVPFSPSKLLDWNASLLTPGLEVMFVGYPNSYSDAMHNLPVVRTGTIASLPMLNFGGTPTFLIDAQVRSGSSGSPVYISAESSGGTFSVVGVIQSGVNMFEDSSRHLGLGHAVKSSELFKLVSDALSQLANK